VKALEPPTVSCSANPTSVIAGNTSAISATGTSPQSRPLSYHYKSDYGTVSGDGPTATLSTLGAPLGVTTVTCNVLDDKGQTASATALVTITPPVAASKPLVSSLCSIHFDRDVRRPSRVDNEGKACLDEIALTLQRSTDAQLALVGNASNNEKASKKLAAERAVNTKAYLTGEKGIDASRVAVYTGSADDKAVAATLIPTGATLDSTGDVLVDESTVVARPRTPSKARP
jgi:outer membrane protein OmpA-like peptidoglycan-associated protein